MKVSELDKYLDKHNLLTGKKALKDDKVKCILSHVLRNDFSANHTNAVACASYKQRECVDESDKDDDDDDDDEGDDDDDNDERSDSEEDLVLNDLDESAESGDSEIEENEDQPELFDQVQFIGLEDWPPRGKADS